MTTRVTSRGYVIQKSTLSPDDLTQLKEDLHIHPKENHVIKTLQQEDKSVIAYRENDQKIYIPRFYGIQHYGEPSKMDLPVGDDIDVPFTQTLRDYQHNIVDIYLNHVSAGYGGGILEVPCGRGKCLGIDTPILMYDGTIQKVQDVQIGDKLMGDDSSPRAVLSLARGRENMYRVYGKKGEGYIANESHIMSLKYSTHMNRTIRKGDILDISIADYLKLPKYYHGRGGPLVGYRVPVEFPAIDPVPIDPYLFGYWLGDVENKKSPDSNEFRSFLTKNNLIKNKHIPHMYKCNTKEIRLQLLAGFIDADGHYHQNCFDIIQKNETILDDIIFLARYLGFSAFKTKCSKTCKNGKHGPIEGTYYRTNIYGKGLEGIPTQCE